MIRYSVQPGDQIFVKDHGFLSFAKNIGKTLSGKYSLKLLDHAKLSATDAFKTSSKRVIQKIEEPTGDWLAVRFLIKLQKILKMLQHFNTETITNEHDKEIHKERYISPE